MIEVILILYYVYGVSVPSLHRESTDSLIPSQGLYELQLLFDLNM